MPGRDVAAELLVCADHPALPGHFPDEPLLPGVVLLEHVIRAAEQTLPSGQRIAGLSRVKFVAPLRPGERAEILLEPRAGGALHFLVRRAGQPIAQGVLQSAATGAAP